MRTVELFCGTKSFSKVAQERGHETFTVDIDHRFEPDMICDCSIMPFSDKLFEKVWHADIIWMSPPCQTFSMAAGNKHWTKDRQPKTEQAKMARLMLIVCETVAHLQEQKDKIFFIENPRARARWFLPEGSRKTVWYCQYGDRRAKPTDIWTNLQGWQPRTCSNNNVNCHHERARRGSKTGTQGLKGAKERGVIPPALFHEIFDIMEGKR